MLPKTNIHTPVLLSEVVALLAPGPGKKFVDATLGAAGHTMALLERGAEVVRIDHDHEIIELSQERVAEAGYSDSFTAKQGAFASVIPTLSGEYDGILFDLGVSSYQLDTASRGFSFQKEAPLDMRMDPSSQQVTAADLVNGLGRKELYELFQELGEERYARRIADELVLARRVSPVATTRTLARIIEGIVPRTGKIHPATKVFQALRMAVNSEREELKAALPSALSQLRVGGTLVVISFHSGEDRIVKSFLKEKAESGELEIIGLKPLSPGLGEVSANPRSRSAKLRAGRRVK